MQPSDTEHSTQSLEDAHAAAPQAVLQRTFAVRWTPSGNTMFGGVPVQAVSAAPAAADAKASQDSSNSDAAVFGDSQNVASQDSATSTNTVVVDYSQDAAAPSQGPR